MKRFLSSAVFVAGLAFGGSVVHADVHPGIQGLNDLLIQKGIVTKEEVDAQAKKHSLNITGYIQVQGMVIENNDATGTGGSHSALTDEDGFKVRRAKLAVSGYAYEHVKFKLEANFAGTTPALDDAFMEDDHLSYFSGKVGQFKVPFSLEELTSDTELLSIERSEVVKQIAPGRDQGISVGGNIPGSIFSYSIGTFNGKASTASTYAVGSYEDVAKNATKNDNDQLLYAGRLVAKPADWISIGVNALTSQDGTGTATEDRTVSGVDLQVKNLKRGCSLQGEYLRQRLEKTGPNVTSEGFYIQAGHFIVPEHLEVALKYEGYDADTAHVNQDDIRWTTIGLNFYIHGHDAKLMANYIFKNERDSYDNNTLLAQVQLRF